MRGALVAFLALIRGAYEFLGLIATGIVRIIGAVVRPLRRLLRAAARSFVIVSELAQRLLRIVGQVATTIRHAIGAVILPVIRSMHAALSSLVTVVRRARDHFRQLVAFVGRPLVVSLRRAGLVLRRLETASGRVLRAAVAVARRFLWWLVRPVVVPARAAIRWSIHHGRQLTARVRVARASIAASVRATVRATRARVRRR